MMKSSEGPVLRPMRSSPCAVLLVVFFATILSLCRAVTAAPQVAFPFNSQVPPAARVGLPFTFTFSPTTFDPNRSKFQYSIDGSPAWLQFDAPNRTLWGTPGTADVGTRKFTITAADANGGMARMSCTLVISSDPTPESSIDVSHVLRLAGNLTGSTSLQLLPSQQVELDFSPDQFDGHGKHLSFYATLADHTPLPSWIQFDSGTLHFSAKPPKLSSSPQNFDILLIASDIPGFAGVTNTFTIIVSDYKWVFDPQEQTIDIPKGSTVNVNMLRSSLLSGSGPAEDSDLDQAAANLPSWLSFDPTSLAITGKPPQGVTELDANITAYDHHGDVANLTLHMRFDSLFRGEIGPIKVTPGQELQYPISRTLLAEPDESVTVNFTDAPWLHFDPKALKLSGKVPTQSSEASTIVNITASTPDHSESDTRQIEILIQKPGNATSSASPTRTSTSRGGAAPTSSDAGTIGQSSKLTPENKGIIAAVIICPLLGIFFAILLVLYCRKARRDRWPPEKGDISRPIDERKDGPAADLERGEPEDSTIHEPPPQLALDLSPKKIARPSGRSMPPPPRRFTSRSRFRKSPASSVIEEGDAEILADFERSPWGYGSNADRSHEPHDSMKIATAIARGTHDITRTSTLPRSGSLTAFKERKSGYSRLPGRGHGRNSTAVCGHCGSSTVNLSGYGHGRASMTTCPQCRARESLCRSRQPDEYSSLWSTTQTGSVVSTSTSAFPVPPTWQSNSANKVPRLSRFSTLKSSKAATCEVGKSEGSSDVASELPDSRSIYDRRQSYIRHRAASRSPFFSSRDSTSSKRAQQGQSMLAEGTGPKKLASRDLKTSVRRTPSQRPLVRTYSASSEVEPRQTPVRKGKERARGISTRWAEGFPRTISRVRNSFTSTIRFEDASEPEWERRSVSIYSQDEQGDVEAGASDSSSPLPFEEESPKRKVKDAVMIGQPPSNPPAIPLPIPPKSPRRMAPRPRSQTEPELQTTDEDAGGISDYPPHESPTIEEPQTVALRRARPSQTRRRSDNTVTRKKKVYPDLRSGTIMDRPRSSFNSPSKKEGGKAREERRSLRVDKRSSNSKGKGKERATDETAFL